MISVPQPTLQDPDAFGSLHLGLPSGIGALAVDQGSGGTNLKTGAATDTGGLPEGNPPIGTNIGLGPPEFNPQGIIGHQFTAGPYATAAEYAAVTVHDKMFPGAVHRFSFAWIGIDPMIQAVSIGQGL